MVLIAFFCLFISLEKPYAQQEEEVLLTFHHPAVGNVYVNSIYNTKTNAVYIPVIEMFSLMEINYQPDVKNFTVQGNFITPKNPYIINLSAMQVQLGKKNYPLTQEDFRLGELDFYLSPKIFEEVFGLNFTVNIDQLALNLETTQTLPVQERKARELARQRNEGTEINKIDFPMGYDRKRSIYSGSMIDYSINADYTANALNLGYTFTGGMEVMGGDLQGTVYGSHSTQGYNFLQADGLRWRYAIRDNDFISGIMAGQTSTTGLQPLNIRGIALTNDPIEPRQMYETTVVDGTTEPESEVELYVNERLTEFKRADELGYYRFNVPISYGTTRISLRIYTPSGQIIVSDKQLQVPFTFLPKGIISYNVQAGQTENYGIDSIGQQWIAHGNIAMGLTNWLTGTVGTQFLGNSFKPDNLLYYGSLSARVAKQYLLNLDAAPKNFYRFTGSVIYASNLSMNFIYTRFDGESIFNSYNATDNLSANVYLPIKIRGFSSGIRLGGEHYILPNGTQTTYRTDFSARIGKIDFRLNYRDNFSRSDNNTAFGQGLFTGAVTYTLSRKPGIPVYVRGMYLRAQTSYNVRDKQMLETEFDLSRTFLKTGRIDASVVYNHQTSSFNTRFGLTLDLNALRSVTSAYISGKKFAARQTLTGSLGWDIPNEIIVTSNRQQVGRAGAAVLLYVDNNNNGRYDDGDQLLPYRGVKLDRTTNMQIGRDSILRLTQLQSYYKYNLSVNRNAIPDPTLVPIKDNFSFIADPNQFKQIEIPFYRGGIAEGAVYVERDGKTSGQGGLRLVLKSVDKDFQTVVRTMSDGNFYVMDLAPDKYTMEIDSIQLGFLNVKCEPEKVKFEIKALAEGDYIEGLTINLIPNEVEKEVLKVTEIQPVVAKDSIVTKILEPLKVALKDTTASIKSDTILAPKVSAVSKSTDSIIVHRDTTVSKKTATIIAPKDTTTIQHKEPALVPSKQPIETKYKGLVIPNYLGEPLIIRNKQGKYSINFGTFSQKKQMKRLVDLINKKSPDKTLIINKNGHYLVSLGYFDNRKEAENIKASIIFKKKSKK